MTRALDGRRAGPFRLLEVAGRGGMGEVWRAEHAQTGFPAAVKVHVAPADPLAKGGAEASWRASFALETRAAANLDHPNVVRLLDVGEWEDGALWLAMEWADGGTLASVREAWGWAETRDALDAVLAGLAHAHARGVLHRDVKPANVLRGGLRAGVWRLADFGLAQLWGASDGALGGWGTPAYMAPEQTRERVAEQGPWTDLYAVGVLGWAMVTGAVPFDGPPARVRQAHALSDLPAFQPRIGVPAAFEGWLRELLAKDPGERPAFAAWARAGLAGLGAPRSERRARPFVVDEDAASMSRFASSVTARLTVGEESGSAATVALDATRGPWLEVADLPAVTRAGAVGAARSFTVEERRALLRPPLHKTAEQPEDARADARLGLGALPLRPTPLVGRQDAQRALRDALDGVLATEAPAVLVLTGPSGSGRTRLAEWIATHAHERGVAAVARVARPTVEAFVDALMGALAAERTPGALEARVRWALDPDPGDQAASVAALLAGTLPSAVPIAERLALLAALSGALARRGPLVIVLDDAESTGVAVPFARSLLAEAGPVLLVTTARDDALHDADAARVAALLALPGVARFAVGPLSSEASVDLVQALLGLDSTLAARVAARTGGSPSYTVQLVRSWGERGWLEHGPHGFMLRPDAGAIGSEDVAAVWMERVAVVLTALGPAAFTVELAAVLGLEVEAEEWAEACASAALHEVASRERAVARLYASRLAAPRAGGWAWAHAPLREAVVRRATEAGRVQDWHRACATALCGRDGTTERVGRHLLAAGEPAGAVEPLIRAAEARRNAGENALALALLEDAHRAADIAELPDADPLRGQILGDRAEALRFLGRADAARAVIAEGRAWADRNGGPQLAARLLHQEAEIVRMEGDAARGVELCRASIAAYRAAGAEVAAGPAFASMAIALRTLAQPEVSVAAAREAAALLSARGGHPAVMGMLVLGFCLSGHDDDEAYGVMERALALAEREGYAAHAASLQHNLADLDFSAGNVERAANRYARAARSYHRLGHPLAVLSGARLAFTRALCADEDGARAALALVGPPPAVTRPDATGAVLLAAWVGLHSLAGQADEAGRMADRLFVALGESGRQDEAARVLLLLARRTELDGHAHVSARIRARAERLAAAEGAGFAVWVRPRCRA